VRALGELYGVPMQNLSAVGYADSRPVVANTTPENRAKNRRVEIVVLERKRALLPDEALEPANEGNIAGSAETDSAVMRSEQAPDVTGLHAPAQTQIPAIKSGQ